VLLSHSEYLSGVAPETLYAGLPFLFVISTIIVAHPRT